MQQADTLVLGRGTAASSCKPKTRGEYIGEGAGKRENYPVAPILTVGTMGLVMFSSHTRRHGSKDRFDRTHHEG